MHTTTTTNNILLPPTHAHTTRTPAHTICTTHDKSYIRWDPTRPPISCLDLATPDCCTGGRAVFRCGSVCGIVSLASFALKRVALEGSLRGSSSLTHVLHFAFGLTLYCMYCASDTVHLHAHRSPPWRVRVFLVVLGEVTVLLGA